MDDLDALFAGAKSAAMQPSDALMARVLADAEAQQPRAVPRNAPAPAPARGFFAGLAAFFGGAGALAGVGSAALAGLFIGFVQPTEISAMVGFSTTTTIDQVELIPDVTALLAGE
jgi:hypothetical protein